MPGIAASIPKGATQRSSFGLLARLLAESRLALLRLLRLEDGPLLLLLFQLLLLLRLVRER